MRTKETREQLRDRLWLEAGREGRLVKGPTGVPASADKCATVREGVLSDGSTVYDVVVSLGGETLTINATNEDCANRIANALNGYSICGFGVGL